MSVDELYQAHRALCEQWQEVQAALQKKFDEECTHFNLVIPIIQMREGDRIAEDTRNRLRKPQQERFEKAWEPYRRAEIALQQEARRVQGFWNVTVNTVC